MRDAAKFLLGLLAGTFAIEIGFRLAELPPLWRVLPIADYLPVVPDPHTAVAHPPHSAGFWLNENRSWVEFNSLGLRDVERSARKPRGTLRVAVLGDSMTEALQVDQQSTFVTKAEAVLKARLNWPVEVINLALSNAYDAVQIERYRSKARDLSIDALFVVVAAIGDGGYLTYPLRDDRLAPAYRPDSQGLWFISHAYREGPEYLFWSSWIGALTRTALEYSRIARIVRKRWQVGFWQGSGQTGPAAKKARTSCADPSFEAHVKLWVDGQPKIAAGRVDAYLSDLAKFSDGNRIPIYIVMLGPLLVCPESLARAAELETAMRKRLTAHGLGLIFASSEMRKHVPAGMDIRRLFGFGAQQGGDGHLNHSGHDIVSLILADAVARHLAAPR